MLGAVSVCWTYRFLRHSESRLLQLGASYVTSGIQVSKFERVLLSVDPELVSGGWKAGGHLIYIHPSASIQVAPD